jgi:hypothetical protein
VEAGMNKVLVIAVALVGVFLIGFVPQYVKASRLDSEARQLRQDSAEAELRELIALTYLQANQKNYGLAAETSSRFFSRVQAVSQQAQDANRSKALQALLVKRDEVTAQLAKGDAAVMSALEEMFTKVREATRR